LFADGQLAGEDLGQKCAFSASWLQEAAIDAIALVSHEVAHGLDFPLGGEDFAMRGHALSGFDLGRYWHFSLPIPQKLYFERRRGKGKICCPMRFDRDYFLT